MIHRVETEFVYTERVDLDDQADGLGLGEDQGPPRFAGVGALHPGVEHQPSPLLERDRDAQVAAYLHLVADRARRAAPIGLDRRAVDGDVAVAGHLRRE